MLANFLEKSKPINFIIYLGFFFCFFVVALVRFYFDTDFNWILLAKAIGFLFLFMGVFFFYNFVITKNKLTFDNSYAFFVFVLMITVLVPSILTISDVSLLLIYLLFLRKIYSLRSSKNAIQKLFDAGFWLGILCILEPFLILFYIVLIAAVVLQQKITLHTIFTPVIGFVTPFVIYFTYLFWMDDTAMLMSIFQFYQNIDFAFIQNVALIWFFCAILLLSIVSILLKSPKALSVNNSFKKSWLLLLINLTIAILFVILIPQKKGAELVFLAVPSSIIIANGFEVIQKEMIKNILFSMMILGTIITFFYL